MTVRAMMKTVAVAGGILALAACGSKEDAAKPAEAAVTVAEADATEAVADTAAAPQTAAGGVLMDAMMGVQVAYLESKLGPARNVSGDERTYEIGGCRVRVHTDDNEVTGYIVPMTQPCSAQAMAALKAFDLPQKLNLTMGEFAASRDNTRFKADCLTLCGNAADPWVYLESEGLRSMPGIRAGAVLVGDAPIDASFRIRDAIKAKMGEDYVVDAGFNCTTEFNALAQRELKDVRIDEIEVGYTPLGRC